MTPTHKPEKKIKKKRLPCPLSTFEQCENLWKSCIKLRALLCSELSGKSAELNAKGDRVIGLVEHHVAHKPNYRLRFDLKNGICITNWEHNYGVHGKNCEEYRTKIIQYVGQERWDYLQSLRFSGGKTDLQALRILLAKELKECIAYAREKISDERRELLKVYLKQIGIEK